MPPSSASSLCSEQHRLKLSLLVSRDSRALGAVRARVDASRAGLIDNQALVVAMEGVVANLVISLAGLRHARAELHAMVGTKLRESCVCLCVCVCVCVYVERKRKINKYISLYQHMFCQKLITIHEMILS